MPTRPRPAASAARRGRPAPGRVRSVRPASLALTLLLALVGLVTAAPASAHARFTGSDPAEGSDLATLPTAVVLSFSEDIAPQFVDTAVVTPDGTTVTTPATAQGGDVTVDLSGPDVVGAAEQGGSWQVLARVVSVDGHPVEHTTTVTVAAGPPAAASGPIAPEPAAAPSSAETTAGAAGPASGTTATAPTLDPVQPVTQGLPRWVVVLGAVALVAAAAAALVVQLRRRPPTG